MNTNKELTIIPEQGLASNNYLLKFNHNAYLIEASTPMPIVQKLLGDAELEALILTHGHFDHIAQLDVWRQACHIPAYIHQMEATYLSDMSYSGAEAFGVPTLFAPAENYLQDEEKIRLSPTDYLQVWHTPGHTPGSICLLWEKEYDDGKILPQALFTGDTIIGESVGRVDFKGGNMAQMKASLAKLAAKLKKLPPNLPVLCGHGPAVDIEYLFKNNLWLKAFSN